MKRLIPILLCLATFGAIGSHAATDIFITNSGATSGVCVTSVQTPAFFNNSANWGAGGAQINNGTTVHICGTISGSLGATVFSFQGGNVRLLFESGAKISSPACPGNVQASACINTNGQPNVTIDGDATGGRQGIIENTANGSALANQRASYAIKGDNSLNLVVKNLTIQNIYVHVAGGSDCFLGSGANGGLSGSGGAGDTQAVSALSADNAIITNNTVSDAGWAFNMGSSNYQVFNNTVSNMDHGVADGSHSGPTSGQKIHHNSFGSMVNWDTAGCGGGALPPGSCTGNCYHHDGIHFFSENGVHTGPKIYSNDFIGAMGNNTTAWIFMEGSTGPPQGIHNDLIFNNTFIDTGAFGKQQIWIESRGQSVNTGVYNNFAYVGNTGNGTACYLRNESTLLSKNNICIGGFGNVYAEGASFSNATVNNNVYGDINAQFGRSNGFVYNGNFQATVGGWKSACGCDSAAVMGTTGAINANLSTGVLSSPSIAAAAGANLTSLGIPELNVDKNGIARPASGAWDAGAFQLTGAPPPPPPKAGPPPILLSAIVGVQ